MKFHVIRLKMKTQPKVTVQQVAASAAGHGGNEFDWLPPELFYEKILLKVDLADRMTCAIAVCKSWRTFQQEPSLWRDINVSSIDGIGLNVDDAGLERLLNTIDASAVRTFDCCYSLSPAALMHALSCFTQLDRLVLDRTDAWEEQSRAGLLRHASVQPWTQTLKHLRLSDEYPTMDWMALASACTNLEFLCVPEVLTASNLTALASAWSDARGAPPALKTITCSKLFGSMPLENLVSFGSLFPALEILALPPFAFDLTTAMAPMNSLLHITLDRHFNAHKGHTMATTEGMEATIRAMLTASPNLQTFQLLHGESKGNPRSAYPGVGTSLTLLPRTLERLYLSDVTLLRADDIDGAALPNLKFLTMLRCGAASIEIETRLIAQCPKLRWQTCCVSVHYCG